MSDLIKREDAISRAWIKNTCKEKIAHYKMRKNRIMAQKSISYDPKPQIEGFDDEIAIYEWILREVDNVPSAEKQGEWLFKEITDDYHVIGQCSVCKERRRIDNYCPNCGCRMKGVE